MKNFIKNLFGLSIKSKILKILNEKINSSQKKLDDTVSILKQSRREGVKSAFRELENKLNSVDNTYNEAVEKAEDDIINSVLSSFNLK